MMNTRKINLWIDEHRLPPDEYIAWCTNSTNAINFIDKFWGRIEVISFDHDLGEESYGTGYDVLKFIEEKVYRFSWEPRMEFRIHSANPVGRKNMQAAIVSISQRYVIS